MKALVLLIGLLNSSPWDGSLLSDSDAKLNWFTHYDGLRQYNECHAEFRAQRSETVFSLQHLGAYCKNGPYWNFEQELESNIDFQIQDTKLLLDNSVVGYLRGQSLHFKFFDRWEDEHVVYLRENHNEQNSSYQFYWGVNSTEFVDFEIESYNLKPIGFNQLVD